MVNGYNRYFANLFNNFRTRGMGLLCVEVKMKHAIYIAFQAWLGGMYLSIIVGLLVAVISLVGVAVAYIIKILTNKEV